MRGLPGAVALSVILLFAAVFAATPGCHRETEEDKVRKVVIGVQNAAEEKDIKNILNRLVKSYRDPQGNDYDSVKGMLLGYFFRHQKIHVYITSLEVNVQGVSAKAVFQAVLSGGNKTESVADILPEALGMYAFEVSLIKDDGDWKIISAKWERVGSGVRGGVQ